MIKTFLLTIFFLFTTSGFKRFVNHKKQQNFRFYIEKRFKPVKEEKTLEVKHKNKLFNKLKNSVYAQIGSNPKYTSNTSYSLFDGDGMIHAVLFNDNNITYQNKWVQTNRLQYENKIGKKVYLYLAEFLDNYGLFNFIIYSIKKFANIIPTVKGTANTALLRHNNKLYALHEGDLPYEINIQYNPFNITTSGSLKNNNLFSTTAHPHYDIKRDLLYMTSYNNYDFTKGKFIFNSFNNDMKLLEQKNVSLMNNGIVHSIAFTGDKLIIPDMPMKVDPLRLFNKKLPLYFDKKNGITRFGILDVDKLDSPEWYYFNNNFYIFHFSQAYETENEYIIYACIIKDPDIESFIHFEKNNTLNRANGILREIRLNKNTKQGYVIDNEKLSDMSELKFLYNLDFPYTSKLNNKEIYCSIFDADDASMRGVVKVNIDNFKNSTPNVFLFDEGTYGVAEFQPVIIDKKEYLLGFIEKKEKNHIALIDVMKKKIESIEIPTRIPPGFHSIYFKK